MSVEPRRGRTGMARYVPGPTGGADTLRLSSNENEWGTSPLAQEAFAAASRTLHRYPDATYIALRRELAARVGASPEHIAIGAGSEQLIMGLISAFAGAGDELRCSERSFALFRIAAQVAGARPTLVPDDGWVADVDALLDGVTTRTRVVAIANPNNPTGTVLPAAEIRRLREGLPAHVLLLLDLAYAELAHPAEVEAAHTLARTRTDTIVLRTFSKAYGLAGARVGWAHGATELLEPYLRMRTPFPVGAAALAAARAALDDAKWLARVVEETVAGRAQLSEGLAALGIEAAPSETNFVLARFTDPADANRALEACLAADISLRPLRMYGLDDCVRITVGKRQANQRVLDALAARVESS